MSKKVFDLLDKPGSPFGGAKTIEKPEIFRYRKGR